jgi:hypothetical protein
MVLVCSGDLTDAEWPGKAQPKTPQHAAEAQLAAPAATRSPAVGGTAAATPASPVFVGSGTSRGPGGLRAPAVTDRILARSVSLPLNAPLRGTTNMRPAAARAFDRAFAAARRAGLSPHILSAWRSKRRQQILFDRAVAKYGSSAKAMRRVLPPNKSAHVKGYAADIEPRSAAAWLERHGAQYGLCRRYDNEWWHFEYLATSDCPPRQPSPAG